MRNTDSYAVSHFIPGLLIGALLGGLLIYILVWTGPISVRDKVIDEQSQHIIELASEEPSYAVIDGMRINAETCRAQTNEGKPLTVYCNEQTDDVSE